MSEMSIRFCLEFTSFIACTLLWSAGRSGVFRRVASDVAFAEFGAFESYLWHDLLLQRAWPPDLEASSERDVGIFNLTSTAQLQTRYAINAIGRSQPISTVGS